MPPQATIHIGCRDNVPKSIRPKGTVARADFRTHGTRIGICAPAALLERDVVVHSAATGASSVHLEPWQGKFQCSWQPPARAYRSSTRWACARQLFPSRILSQPEPRWAAKI